MSGEAGFSKHYRHKVDNDFGCSGDVHQSALVHVA